jgi:hypothetical protein
MYETLTTLNSENLTALRNLRDQLQYNSNVIRLGVSGADNPSVHQVSRWKNWTRAQKTDFKNQFSQEFLDTAVIGWIVKYPANTGFLDKMNAWTDSKVAGTVVAYALEDSQNIWIDDIEVIVNSGEGIKFSLKQLHEVKKQSTEQSWACLMCLI